MKNLPDGVALDVKVVPRAKQTARAGFDDDILTLRLAAPPVDGKANAALIAYLAKSLRLKRSQVEIKSGEKSRHKVVILRGVDADTVRRWALEKE
ncbi:MAG: DUF167 domain-containing protein [Vulcanimicrobiota bacterium]